MTVHDWLFYVIIPASLGGLLTTAIIEIARRAIERKK